jgi:hypothetical protein
MSSGGMTSTYSVRARLRLSSPMLLSLVELGYPSKKMRYFCPLFLLEVRTIKRKKRIQGYVFCCSLPIPIFFLCFHRNTHTVTASVLRAVGPAIVSKTVDAETQGGAMGVSRLLPRSSLYIQDVNCIEVNRYIA